MQIICLSPTDASMDLKMAQNGSGCLEKYLLG